MQTKFNIEINQLADLVSVSSNFVLTCHQNPDGDTVSSALALYHFLKKTKQNVHVVVSNQIPDFLKKIPGCNEIIIYSEEKHENIKSLFSNADILFSIDYNDPKRINELEHFLVESKAKKVLIDHHPEPKPFADIVFSDVSVSSTAELMFNILFFWNKQLLDKEIAGCALTGIITDTGCFSYNSSENSTYQTVAEILKFGVDKDKIIARVIDNFSENRMRLMGYILYEKMEILPEYRTGIIILTKEELEKFNYQVGDSEGFVNMPLSVKDIVFSVYMMERDNHVRISFRSKGDFNVNAIAREYFNGGGHFNASGGKSYISLNDTVRKLKNILPQFAEKLRSVIRD